MSGGTGWNGPLQVASSMTLWGQAKEALIPIVTYWVWVAYAFFAFAAMLLVTGSPDGEDLMFLTGFALATFGGVALGQLCAFARVRTWVLLAIGAMMWTAFFVFLAAGGEALMSIDAVAVIVISVLFLGPVAMTGGLWSLETNRSMWATWLPMVWTVAACLTWIEKHGGVATFEAGDKYAVWDLVSFGVFVPSVGLFLLYLVTRETHRLATWKRGPSAPLRPTVEERGVSRPRVTFAGLLLLAAMGFGLAAVTAVVAPYLWRTGPPDDHGPKTTQQDSNRSDRQQKAQSQDDRNGKPGPPKEPRELPDGAKEALQKMADAGKKAAGTVCSVLSIALMLGLGALLTYRPLKRLIVLRHLRDPLWDVAPSTRIDQCWRLVEIAMADAGVTPRAGEDAASLARRAVPALQKLSPVPVHGFEEVAEVADRVRFGLGVGPADVEVIERFARWVIDTVWERLDDRQQVVAMYRSL